MKKFTQSHLKECKLSELADIAMNNEIGLVTYWKSDDNILCQKISHIRYFNKPKAIMDRYNIFYSGENSAMNPNHYCNDMDSISYVLWIDGE